MKKNLIVEAIIESELLPAGSTVIVGLSGGPDSLCLLHALAGISDAYDYEIIPVHINHHLRAEAEEEADNAVFMCEKLDLECRVYDADCKEMADELGIGIEEAGREVRYQIFDEVADELADEGRLSERIFIALAHNADDQCETVLFRLIRGTGPHGLSGIPAYRLSASGYPIVRPIISVSREEIESYIKEHRLRPNIDKSNSDSTYMRNKIRNELIPYLEKNYNPGIKENLRRYAAIANLDDALLRDIAFSEYTSNIEVDSESKKAILDLSVLRDNPPAINSRIASLIFELLDLDALTTYENIMDVTELMYSDRVSSGIDLPMGLRAYREYDRLIFSAGEEVLTADDSIDIYPQVIMIKDYRPDDEMPHAAFDFDKFNKEHPGRLGDIALRTRREGDYLPIKDGRKKIQDVFVDSKVKKNARESVQMACIGEEVLWILPNEHFYKEQERNKGKFSSKYHISEATERVLFIEIVEIM